MNENESMEVRLFTHEPWQRPVSVEFAWKLSSGSQYWVTLTDGRVFLVWSDDEDHFRTTPTPV